MEPLVAVLLTSDSFGEVWEQLTSALDARLRAAEDAAELAPLGEACAVVVSAGGTEDGAVAHLDRLAEGSRAPVAVAGADTDHRVSARIVRAGASDYFALPADLELLRSWLAERIATARAAEGARALAEYQRRSFDFSALVGESPELKAAIDRAARVIPRDRATVLITGETGTGKELLAQAVHYNGPRADKPFVEVNCSAIPATLLESELFGYEKGAFTDARASKPGLLEAAHGGTLFLDEIGDLSLEMQTKLLKVLEDRSVRRLGSLRSVDVDLRLVTATHVDLAEAVQKGTFREDLYYRLNVVPIHLPPLRERGSDVILLAEHFLATLAREYGMPAPPLDAETRMALLAHSWPGNVRELRNGIERALLLGDGALRASDVFLTAPTKRTGSALPFPASIEEIERAAAQLAVDRHQGNKSAAADLLGISRSRLYRLLSEKPE